MMRTRWAFILLQCLLVPVLVLGDCEKYRPLKGDVPKAWSQPKICAGNKYDFKTQPLTKAGTTYPKGAKHKRTNSIQDFCIVTDMYSPESPATGPPYPSGSPDRPPYTPSAPPPQECYVMSPPPPPRSPGTFHSAGKDPNWAILDHLVRHKAQSFQPHDDLPFVAHDFYDDIYLYMTSGKNNSPPLPKPLSANPYFVEVTGVSVKGDLLHNFLHFRIFANMSVALGKEQLERHKTLHQAAEIPNYAVGKISAVVIMVKDQDGWPVGDFSRPVPCHKTCRKYSHDVFYGDERNAVPCSYTPPFASSIPGMFIYDADPGRYCTKEFQPPGFSANSSTPAASGPSTPTSDPRDAPQTARMEGVREVHATWSFGHNTCNFVQRLYIQTLIFEDVETVYPGHFFDYKPADSNPPPEPTLFLFGWTAQYNILQPTRSSLGAPDYVDLKYLREREAKAAEIDCHVPLFDAENVVKAPFRKFYMPTHELMSNPSLAAIQEEIRVPSRSGYTASLWAFFKKDSSLQSFGQHSPEYESAQPKCREWPKSMYVEDELKAVVGDKRPETLTAFLTSTKQPGIRCPCPQLPSTLSPENRTADPARLHGRLIHASHMAIAYMFLTPIGCFVARYYKETFVTIFCFQEYWWFMWHVVCLMAACMFNIGAITSIARKKAVELKYNDNLAIHVMFGTISIFVFYMEIITGFFRVADPKKRMRQIFGHWLIGMMNNGCAVMSMFAMAWVDQSGFSCNVAYTVCFWLVFVVVCYVIMEVDMRKTDRKLLLVPRRSYLPPPVKRLFTKEPPGRQFRLTMLAVFIFGLLVIQGMVSYYIWDVEGGASCEEEFRESALKRRRQLGIGNVEEDGEGGPPGSGGEGSEYNNEY